MSFELIPFDDIKDFLGLEEATIASYPDMSVILLRLLSSFEEYTDRRFELVERTEEIFVGSTAVSMMPLKGLPISSISSVMITSTEYGDSILTTGEYDITDYGLRLFTKVLNCKLSVTYTGGLSTSSDEIKGAALYQLAYEWQAKDQVGAESVSTEGGSVYRPELGLLKETKRMLRSLIHPLNVGSY